MRQRRLRVPRPVRRVAQRRRDAAWYRALIRNARNRREELARIDARLATDERVGRLAKALLRRRLARCARTAAAERPAPSPAIQALRDAGFVEDTTAYEKPLTTLIHFPFHSRLRQADRRRRDP